MPTKITSFVRSLTAAGAAASTLVPFGVRAETCLPDSPVAPSVGPFLAAVTAVAKIDGMNCPLCARAIERRLIAFPSIALAHVSLDDGLVFIGEKTGRTIPLSRLRATLEELGFAVVALQRSHR